MKKNANIEASAQDEDQLTKPVSLYTKEELESLIDFAERQDPYPWRYVEDLQALLEGKA